MSDEKKHDDGDGSWPAYPHQFKDHGHNIISQITMGGLTARQHAAIELRVPDSGLDWLDVMIEKRNLMDFAGQAMLALITAEPHEDENYDGGGPPQIAIDSYRVSASMIAEKRRREADNG